MMAANREDDDRQYGVVNVQPEFAALGSGLDKAEGHAMTQPESLVAFQHRDWTLDSGRAHRRGHRAPDDLGRAR